MLTLKIQNFYKIGVSTLFTFQLQHLDSLGPLKSKISQHFDLRTKILTNFLR